MTNSKYVSLKDIYRVIVYIFVPVLDCTCIASVFIPVRRNYPLVRRVLRPRDLAKKMIGSGMDHSSIRKTLIAFRELPSLTRNKLLGASN